MMKKLEKDDLVILNTRSTSGYKRKLKRNVCRIYVKKYSFPHKSIAAGNELIDETACTKTVHKFK